MFVNHKESSIEKIEFFGIGIVVTCSNEMIPSTFWKCLSDCQVKRGVIFGSKNNDTMAEWEWFPNRK